MQYVAKTSKGVAIIVEMYTITVHGLKVLYFDMMALSMSQLASLLVQRDSS